MERENEAHSWSLEIKIENFLDKNNSFKRNNEHAMKKIDKKTHREGKRSITFEFFVRHLRHFRPAFGEQQHQDIVFERW